MKKKKKKEKGGGLPSSRLDKTGLRCAVRSKGRAYRLGYVQYCPMDNGTDFAVSFCPRDNFIDCVVLSSGQSYQLWDGETEEIGCLNGHVAASTWCQ
jgi:hypothetical protein